MAEKPDLGKWHCATRGCRGGHTFPSGSCKPDRHPTTNTGRPLALLAEVERLRAELEAMTAVARGNKRHVADLTFQLERVEALTKDTDGGDIDPDAEIPVGEVRRALYEPLPAYEVRRG